MGVFELKINHLVLDCAYCQQPLRPDQIRGQAYTVGEMKSPQSFRFFPSSTSLLGLAVRWRPHLLWCLHPPTRKGMYLQLPFAGPHHRSDEVQMHLLRLWGRIHPLLQVFWTQVQHRRCRSQASGTADGVRVLRGRLHQDKSTCLLWMRASSPTSYFQGELSSDLTELIWMQFGLIWFWLHAILPLLQHISGDVLICSPCYRGDIVNYVCCSELDYLVQGITVKCVACQEYIPFSTLASHQLRECPSKHKLQKITPGSSARKNLCGNTCMPLTSAPLFLHPHGCLKAPSWGRCLDGCVGITPPF